MGFGKAGVEGGRWWVEGGTGGRYLDAMFGGSGVRGEGRRVELFLLLIDCFFGESWRVWGGCWCSDLRVGGWWRERGTELRRLGGGGLPGPSHVFRYQYIVYAE